MKKEIYLFAFFMVLVLLVGSFVSAGFFDDLFGKITGKATTQATNVTLTAVGTAQVTIVVVNGTITGAAADPSEDTFNLIEIFVNVSDSDGVNDINDSSVNMSVQFFDQAVISVKRTNSSCVLVGDLNANTANFSCSFNMYYFYANGIWNITVFANDLGNKTAVESNTTTFDFGELKAIKLSPTGITFASVSPGDINVTGANDPTLLNNTGNFNVTSELEINATNLIGVSVQADEIPVANFTIDIDTGGNPPVECFGGTTPVNATSTAISNSLIPRGNHTLQDGSSGQEQIYYCVNEVPVDISSQTYSSAKSDNGYGAWTFKIL